MLQNSPEIQSSLELHYIDVSTELYNAYNSANTLTSRGPANTSTSDTVDELVVIGYRPTVWPPINIPIGSIAFEDGYYGIFRTAL